VGKKGGTVLSHRASSPLLVPARSSRSSDSLFLDQRDVAAIKKYASVSPSEMTDLLATDAVRRSE
jgi:hypothetical protein